jgi:chaperonin GroES
LQEEEMKVVPIGDRVLLSTEESEGKTKSGLFIPQTAQEKTQTGLVVAVGDDKDAIKVKKGDRVMYDKYAGTTIQIEGKDHLIISMSDIIATIS